MEILRKIATNKHNPPTTIAFLGDSVTQGCFRKHCDYDAVYHSVLKKKLEVLCPNSVINIINAGIRGTSSEYGAERLYRDVISKNPDLCVVCFGLNDVTRLEEGLQLYIDSLSKIFEELKNFGCEIIFMTPNMINTYVCENVFDRYIEYAGNSMKWQNDGLMDKYMETGIAVAKKYGVPVCDVYGKWKKLNSHGVDTTMLLAEGINHPIREMHELFATSLLDTMME